MRAAQPGGVGVAGEADDRDVRVGLGDLLRLDAGDVGEHELRLRERVGGDEMVAGKQHVELAPEEEVDPDEQDRCHRPDTSISPADSNTLAG